MAKPSRVQRLMRGRVFGLERRSQAQGFRARRSAATYGLLRGFIRPSEARLGVYVRVNSTAQRGKVSSRPRHRRARQGATTRQLGEVVEEERRSMARRGPAQWI